MSRTGSLKKNASFRRRYQNMRRKDELDSVNERRGSLGTKSPNSTWTNMTDKLPLLSRNNKSDSAMRSPDSIEKRIDDGLDHDSMDGDDEVIDLTEETPFVLTDTHRIA